MWISWGDVLHQGELKTAKAKNVRTWWSSVKTDKLITDIYTFRCQNCTLTFRNIDIYVVVITEAACKPLCMV